MKLYFNAQELAELSVQHGWTDLPNSVRGWQRHAQTKGWNGDELCRDRRGKGGGKEYHVSLLPDAAQSNIRFDQIALEQEASSALATRQTALVPATALTARQREVMEARAAILKAIEAIETRKGCSRKQAIKTFRSDPAACSIADKTLIAANNKGAGKTRISEPTLFRWFRMTKDGTTALAPNTSKRNNDRPDWFKAFLKFYQTPVKPTITQALEDYTDTLNEGDFVPSYDQCKRLIAKMGDIEKHRGREGPRTLKNRKAYVSRDTSDLEPTTIYTADGKTFDAEIAHPNSGHPFRPEITTVVDVATRMIVGFSVGLAENSLDVVDALRHACEKRGIPAMFYVDNGSGFKNDLLDNALTGFMGRLGITKTHSIAYNSQARGIIERVNKTVWNPLSKKFPTYIGADMDAEAKQRVHKITRKEIREHGISSTLPSWEAFLEKVEAAIATYNRQKHRSVPNGMSPEQYWEYHVQTGFEPTSITPSEADDLWRPYVIRKVRRCLIEFNTNSYFSLSLEEFNGQDVLVGYDIHDASKVWVREIDGEADGYRMGRLLAIAEFEGNKERYVPLTVERAALEKRAAGQVRRLGKKLEVVKDNVRETILLEQTAQPIIEPHSSEIDLVPANPTKPKIKSDALMFDSDADLAKWAIKHPDQINPNQRSVLQKCLRSNTDRELMELEGVDLESLGNVIREVA